ncbi:MAG: pyridoxamine 5'-phosphate oxidase [Actinomycetota bacterium]|nr:pyridoxamine 5'-phosphate oxidase [Actinomycetota bacterium]
MHFLPTGPSYNGAPLDRDALGDDPIEAVRRWLDEAYVAQVPQPNAMSLATASEGGRPSVRTVLVKSIDSGMVFFTNYGSMKAAELEANPWGAVSLTWLTLHRQVRAAGRVERITAAESDDYFTTRPRGAQLAAAASSQSRVLGDRQELVDRMAQLDDSYPDVVPRPPHWGGYRLLPSRVEFWQGRLDRMHDRVEFVRHGDTWLSRLLWP